MVQCSIMDLSGDLNRCIQHKCADDVLPHTLSRGYQIIYFNMLSIRFW